MDDDRCIGITQSGLQCRRPGSPYCYQHRPPSEALNFDAASQGGEHLDEDQEMLFAATFPQQATKQSHAMDRETTTPSPEC